MIVLDTNVLSELMRPKPEPAVLAWLSWQISADLRTTAVTAAEIRYGIARLPDGNRKHDLARAADELFAAFPDQILPFDDAAAAAYAAIVTRRDRAGTPVDGFDGQIAAICAVHRATLATRNTKDFDLTGVPTTNPWTAT
jgi:predicted nucleic acid-binding protein